MKRNFFILIGIVFLASILRFYHLSSNPPGLYIDEASIGYNAYKILTTGKDEYGIPHPMAFKSFGDYKMPVYIYATAGAMAFFGKTEFAIRFTSAAAGVLTVIVFYVFLADLLEFDKASIPDKMRAVIPLLSAFLLAISPWHIQFSRAGFEVNVGVFLFLLSTWMLLKYYKKQSFSWLFVSIIFFAISVYTYHIFRILTPIMVITSFIFMGAVKKGVRMQLLTAFVLFMFFILPLALFSLSPEGSERFGATSAFSEYKAPTLIDKATVYPLVFLRDYMTFYSTEFLFNFGDGFGRHQVPDFGVLPRWTLPFLLIGLYSLLKMKKSMTKNVLLFLFFMSPLAASIARPSPHSLRDLLAVIPITALIAFGLYTAVVSSKRWQKIVSLGIICVIFFETSLNLHFYYVHYPKVNLLDWGAGYKQIVEQLQPYKKIHPKIVVDSNLGYAPVYFHFYDESLHLTMVNAQWKKPPDWKNPVIYIRPNYGNTHDPHIVSTVYLPNLNHDVYAQFYKL